MHKSVRIGGKKGIVNRGKVKKMVYLGKQKKSHCIVVHICIYKAELYVISGLNSCTRQAHWILVSQLFSRPSSFSLTIDKV